MKRYLIILAVCFLAGAGWTWAKNAPKDAKTFVLENIIWHGQSAIEVRNGMNIFCDPYKLKNTGKADLILITHPHPDHLSPEDIKKIQTSDTVIVAPDDPLCKKKLTGEVIYMKPGETINVKGVVIEAVRAYNTGITSYFHKKASKWLGYIFTVDGIRIYTAGDTDLIPEMKEIYADIAFLPVGGLVTMSPAEASTAALEIKPKIAIPMHYGIIPGSSGNGEKFRNWLANKMEVIVMQAQ